MMRLPKIARRVALLACTLWITLPNTGCVEALPLVPFNFLLFEDFSGMVINYCAFWKTTPIIPVSPYYSQLVEDTYHEEEYYGKVPVLDPVEGEHAPIYCLDPPSPDEIVRTMPNKTGGGLSFFAETTHNNVRMTVEPIVDKLEECRFYPLVGPAKLHKCHYKCTIYYDKTIRSFWPVPFSHDDESQEVVYIDHDHLIRCAGPDVATPPSP